MREYCGGQIRSSSFWLPTLKALRAKHLTMQSNEGVGTAKRLQVSHVNDLAEEHGKVYSGQSGTYQTDPGGSESCMSLQENPHQIQGTLIFQRCLSSEDQVFVYSQIYLCCKGSLSSHTLFFVSESK